jgi:hypothetical protein
MMSTPQDLDHPRAWLRDVVQFTLDEFTGDPLNLQRAAAAMNVVYQYHERLFYYLTRTGKASAESIEGFRTHLGRASPSFCIVAKAGGNQTGQALAFANIILGGPELDILGTGTKLRRAVIVAGPKRQLIPLLEDVVVAYRRVLDAHGL